MFTTTFVKRHEIKIAFRPKINGTRTANILIYPLMNEHKKGALLMLGNGNETICISSALGIMMIPISLR